MTPLLGLLRTSPATSKSVPLDTMETYLTMWTPLALVYVQEAITVHTRVVETALSEPASGFLKFIAKPEPNVAKIP